MDTTDKTKSAISTSALSTPQTPIIPINPVYDVNGYTTGANQSGAYITSTLQNTQNQAQADADLQKANLANETSSMATLASQLNGQGTNLRNSTIDQANQVTGATDKLNLLNRINAEAQGLQYKRDVIPLELQRESVGRGRTDAGLAPLETAALRDNAIALSSKAYEAAIASADYNAAQNESNKLVNLKYDGVIAEINAKKANIENIRGNLTEAQKKAADAQTRLLDKQKQDELDKKAEELRVANEKITTRREIEEVLLKAQQGNAPKDLISTVSSGIDNGTLTRAKAIQMLGQYTGPIPASAQEYQYAVNHGYKGSFSQYQTEDANRKAVGTQVSDSTTVLPQDTTKALGQLSFLKNQITSAEALKEASGQSGLKTKAGDWFVGGTKYRQLENINNTLKTNILTMMVDPAVKKFFGPQMTNADVRLMTAGGTTLNVEAQTPEQMQEELTRLKDLFTRAENAVKEGMGQPVTPVSTPNTNQTPVPQFEGYTLGADGKYYKNK